MDTLTEKMLSCKVWCVAGSTHDPQKFANMIYKKLKGRDYDVFSLNPSGRDADDDKSYKILAELPVKPDVINMVINPVKGREIISDAIDLGIKYIWFQPGAESEELIRMAEISEIEVVHNRCVLVELE